jgi:hypothetical protein
MGIKVEGVAAKNFSQQINSLWINPEIARRRSQGKLPEGFALSAIQLIFRPEPSPPEVRFNEEVKMDLKLSWINPPEGLNEIGDEVVEGVLKSD